MCLSIELNNCELMQDLSLLIGSWVCLPLNTRMIQVTIEVAFPQRESFT